MDKSQESNTKLLPSTESQNGPTKQVTFQLEKSSTSAATEAIENGQDKTKSKHKKKEVESEKIVPPITSSTPEHTLTDEVDDNGYWTSPPLSQLKSKSLSELRSIKGFKIGRKHYGQVEFLDPVDLSSIVNLDDIAGNVIIFGSKSCLAYPDENRPKKGEGLNLPARITLEGCYPLNKADKMPILDPKSEVVKLHIENLKKLPYMNFESYDAATGNWTFTVESMDA